MNSSWIIRTLVKLKPTVQGLLSAILTSALLILLDQMSIHLGLSEGQRVIDDVAGGIIAGMVVFAYARVRCNYIEQRLRTVDLMNHHIRNALQVIRYSDYMPETQQVSEVNNAINRIDWALREILTGRVTTYDETHTDEPNSDAA